MKNFLSHTIAFALLFLFSCGGESGRATYGAQWAKTATGGANDAQFNAIGHDSAGSVYAAGVIFGTGTYDFGNGIAQAGSNDGYYTAALVKYDSSGLAQWAKVSTAGGDDSKFEGVASDADGNTCAVGRIHGTGTFDFGNGVTATGAYSGDNIVIVKYDSYGTAQWARTVLSASDESSFNAAAIDPSGNIYAVGIIGGSSEYAFGDGVTATAPAAGDSAVIVMYSSSGAARNARTVSVAAGESEFDAVAVDGSGSNVYATGKIYGSGDFNFGSGIINAAYAGGDNAVIVRYDSSLVSQWAGTTTVAGNESRYAGGVVVDPSGDIYVGGHMNGTDDYDFGSGAIHGTHATDNAVIVKYASSSTGAAEVANTIHMGDAYSSFTSVGIDASNNIYAVGLMGGNVVMDFGSGVTAIGGCFGINDTAMLVRYNSSLVAQWAGSSATASATGAGLTGVTADDDGVAYAVGWLNSNSVYDFGNGVTVGDGSADKSNVLIAKYTD